MANDNFHYRTSTEALPSLLRVLLSDLCSDVGSRNGRTKEMCHIGITLTEPWKRELLLPARKHNLAAQIAETMWVLAGRNDIGFLSHYLPRAKDYSDDGVTWRGAYGPRLRGRQGGVFNTEDQVAWVVKELQANPLTRQAVINIYDAGLDMGTVSKDIPCNDFLQFTNRLGKLDLHVYIRSNDALWGWSGINAFEWSALQEIVAGLVGVAVGSLHFSVGSFHVYDKHWEKAQKIIEDGALPGEFKDSPRFKMPEGCNDLASVDSMIRDWFKVERAIREGYSEVVEGGPCVNEALATFPEPMLRSWLQVIAWWWTGDWGYIDEFSRLRASASLSVQRKPDTDAALKAHDQWISHGNDWLRDVKILHEEKDLAYGDSWKRRGEMLGILANIARKIDRLGTGKDTTDETQADTSVDLMIYLAKYRWWIADQEWGTVPITPNSAWKTPYSDHTVEPVAALLDRLDDMLLPGHNLSERPVLEERLTNRFMDLEHMVMDSDDRRSMLVDSMLTDAFLLARSYA